MALVFKTKMFVFVEDGDDARRSRREEGEAGKAKEWSRLKKDRPPPGTWAGG